MIDKTKAVITSLIASAHLYTTSVVCEVFSENENERAMMLGKKTNSTILTIIF